MSRIKILDKNTVDQIAAGESIERPANIAKELIENAIDSGADAITVEIKDGGITYLRVTDNGCGIEEDDIPLAFIRHATSKIEKADDLEHIGSLGFRGEALASIAAVSRVELISKREDDISGTRYVIEGGDEKNCDSIGAPDGTTIIVRDLFYNIPARAKFLKTPMTEASRISSFVEMLTLSHPDVSFNFIVNGNPRITTDGSGELKNVIFNIYGKLVAAELLKVDYEYNDVRIGGYIAKPTASRKNRNCENYFINGRYVKSNIIARAIEDGFGHMLMQHCYPFSCLTVELDPSRIDINVHPAKMEVRFSEEKLIYDCVSRAVRETLNNQEMIVNAGVEIKREKSEKRKLPPEPFEAKLRNRLSENVIPEMMQPNKTEIFHKEIPGRQFADEKTASKIIHENNNDYGVPASIKPEEFIPADINERKPEIRYEQQEFVFSKKEVNESKIFLSDEGKSKSRIVGQIFDTYWIVEYENKLLMIDQHAAHEKVLFEKFLNSYKKSEILSQQLNPPMVITLTTGESATLELYHEAFEKLGFEIEPFGDKEYKISAMPLNLSSADPKALFMDILDSVETEKNVREMPTYVNRIATEACKAAVKGGGRISLAEAQELIDSLMELEDPYHCPHGRPTIISFSKQDLEKKFKRII